eukprot:XP_027317421.1 uncharacterized protein LOC113844138 isoform X2 [Anas platyrhynchos]
MCICLFRIWAKRKDEFFILRLQDPRGCLHCRAQKNRTRVLMQLCSVAPEGCFGIEGRKPDFRKGIQTGSSNVPGRFLSQTGKQPDSQSAYFRDSPKLWLQSWSSELFCQAGSHAVSHASAQPWAVYPLEIQFQGICVLDLFLLAGKISHTEEASEQLLVWLLPYVKVTVKRACGSTSRAEEPVPQRTWTPQHLCDVSEMSTMSLFGAERKTPVLWATLGSCTLS